MKHLLPRMLFISAYRSEHTFARNCVASDALRFYIMARGMRYVRCVGTYQGTKEDTYGVVCERPWTVGMLFDVAKNNFGQDSVLLREPDGSCWILSKDLQGDYIGQWGKISREIADTLDAHTRVGIQYFAAR